MISTPVGLSAAASAKTVKFSVSVLVRPEFGSWMSSFSVKLPSTSVSAGGIGRS